MRPLVLLVLLWVAGGCRRDVEGACVAAIDAQNRCYAQAYSGHQDSGLYYSDPELTAQLCAIADASRVARGRLVKHYQCQADAYDAADCSTGKGYDAAETQALVGCL